MIHGAGPSIIATKVSAPVLRPETIARDRVARLLADAIRRPLTVVCAPAGYGKTTALAEALRAAGPHAAWVSLDAADDDPRRLWAHVLAALERVLPGAAEAARVALDGGSNLAETVVPLTVNALAERACGGLLLVIDDYHHVTDPDAHRLLTILLDTLPSGVSVALGSRTRPPLRLSRRRALGTLSEIGPEQLAFRGAEAELLLNGALALELSARELALVDERVAGWPAGLSLLAASLAEGIDRRLVLEAFARTDGRVAQYLIEEVCDATDPALLAFLLRTAIVRRLSAPLAEALLGDPSAHALFAEVRRSNLFVTAVDGDVAWIRYHDLFAEVLRRELEAREPELLPELHGRASRWYEQARMIEEAIAHASAAGDGPRAARLVRDADVHLLVGRSYASARRLLDAIPTERGEFGPFCDALYTLSLQLDGAEPTLVFERLEQLRALGDAGGIERIVDQARISPFFGRVGDAVREGRRAYERYSREPPAIRHSIAAQLGMVLWFAGERAGAREVIERHLDAMVFLNSKAWALAVLAFCAAEEDDVETADRRAREAIALAERTGGSTAPQYVIAYQAHAEVLRLQGRFDAAERTLDHAGLVTRMLPGSISHALTLLLRAQLAFTLRDLPLARRAAAATRAILDRYPDVGMLAVRLAELEQALDGRATDALLGTLPTPAERRLLTLLASDRTLDAIARELYVSINTVTSHRRRLYRRLGAGSRAEAIAVARERGLL